MFPGHLRKMSVVLLLGGVFCVCLLTQLVYSVVQVLLLLIDLLSDFLSIIGSGLLIHLLVCCCFSLQAYQ